MKFFKNLLLPNFDILSFIILATIKLLAYGRYIEDGYFSYETIFTPILASVIILCSFALIFKQKTRTKVLYGFNVVITLIIVADMFYFGYFRDILSIPVLRNGTMLGPVKASIISLFKPDFLLFLVDLFILPFFYFKKLSKRLSEKLSLKNYTLKLRLSTFCILFVFSCSINAYQIYKLNEAQPRLLTTMYNRIYIAKSLGNFNFHLLDCYNFISEQIQNHEPLPTGRQSEIETYLAVAAANMSETTLSGVADQKNLIVIQVEALQGFALNTTISGAEITPNLNAFLKKSSYFDNYFYQVASGNTSDAEFMTNNSLYPAAQGAVAYLYYSNEFNSLPKALDKKGYYSAALHGYKEDFWNRNVMNKTEGFNIFYGEKSFTIDETIGLGLSDKSFFTQSMDKINNLKQPYYAFLTTLSSHYPFDDVHNYGSFNVGDLEGTLLGNYLKSIHYADEQLGMFLNALAANGTLDKSVLVLYGDHYAMPKDEQDNVNKLLNLTDTSDLAWMQLQKVPLMIHFPQDANAGVNHLYSGEMDLYPTLANLFTLPITDMLGKDLYNSVTGSVTFRNGSFTDGKNFYLAPTDSYYNIDSKQKIQANTELLAQKETSINQLQYSDDILSHNLLKKFNTQTK